MPDPQIQLLLESLERAFDHISWHGPNLADSFRGLDAKTAARKIAGRKSIHQQVLHAAYWKQRVLNKLIGTQRFARRGSNWPQAGEWKEDQLLLHEIHAKLHAAVESLDPQKLTPKLRMMILGVAAHDVYHAGQIRLLRKMLGRTKRASKLTPR